MKIFQANGSNRRRASPDKSGLPVSETHSKSHDDGTERSNGKAHVNKETGG